MDIVLFHCDYIRYKIEIFVILFRNVKTFFNIEITSYSLQSSVRKICKISFNLI